jgi:3-deoxy-D-manno-octulosonate 8-phosphate phosphatase (KDO 8-P phosphatase)
LNKDVLERARKIKLLLMDCDGVLTDGKLYYSASGEELKVFHVRDGQGLVFWHQGGFRSGIITGRKSKILETRATELGIHFIKQASKDKAKDFETILNEAEVSAYEVAFIGDDLVDLVLFEKVGLSVAVADAAQPLFEKANYITKLNGGLGAVREVIDLLIESKK